MSDAETLATSVPVTPLQQNQPDTTPEPVLVERSAVAEQLLDAVLDSLRLDDRFTLEALIIDLHPAEQADLIEFLTRDQRQQLLEAVGPLLDAETLTYLDGSLREDVIEELDDATVAAALTELDTDDAIDILEDLDDADQAALLKALPEVDRALIEGGLTFPEESVGRLMNPLFVAVPLGWNVGQAIDYLRAASDLPETFYNLFMMDEQYRPVGEVPVSRALRSKRGVTLESIMRDRVHPMSPTMDQEEAAHEFRQYGLVSAPVVDDADGRMIGVVMIDDVVDVIDEEADEDMLALAGVSTESGLFDSPWEIARSRFPWLLINLGTAVAASLVIGLFESQLQQIVALAVLMPIVASMGGNAGTQTVAVAIRALAMRDLSRGNAGRFLIKELTVGALNGLAFAVVASLVALVWYHDFALAGVIAIAMIVNLIVASVGGALIPLVLERLKIDPANASGVLLTTATDIIGFFAFLGVASALLF